MCHVENETEACKGSVRTDGPHAQESAPRFAVQTVRGEGDVANQTTTREDAAAGGILEGDSQRYCLLTSKRRTQRHLGAEGELQRGGACSFYIRSAEPYRLTVYTQAKQEAGPSGLLGFSGADVKMEDAGDDDDDEDEDDEDMEEVS